VLPTFLHYGNTHPLFAFTDYQSPIIFFVFAFLLLTYHAFCTLFFHFPCSVHFPALFLHVIHLYWLLSESPFLPVHTLPHHMIAALAHHSNSISFLLLLLLLFSSLLATFCRTPSLSSFTVCNPNVHSILYRLHFACFIMILLKPVTLIFSVSQKLGSDLLQLLLNFLTVLHQITPYSVLFVITLAMGLSLVVSLDFVISELN